MPNVDAVVAKYNAESSAEAESAVESPSAPPAGGSAAGSAPADEALSATTATSPGATNEPPLDHDELRAKLDADRERHRAKELRRKAKADADAAAKTKAEADAELAKWKAIGKDQSFLDALKAAGRDPREVYEQMRQEALKAGTPDARIEALEKKYAAELEGLRAELKKRDDREAEREKEREEQEKRSAAAREDRVFQGDFQHVSARPEFATLLEEYDPPQLFALANSLRRNPETLFAHAKSLKVGLTSKGGNFNMLDIFRVMHATQAAHRARAAAKKTAAPQTSETPAQGSEANRTVNGTAERKADTPTTIGNHIATSNAASKKTEQELRASMTRDEWREYVRKKHENARL